MFRKIAKVVRLGQSSAARAATQRRASRRLSLEILEGRMVLSSGAGTLPFTAAGSLIGEMTGEAPLVESKTKEDFGDFYWAGSEKVSLRRIQGELAVGLVSQSSGRDLLNTLIADGSSVVDAVVVRDLSDRAVVVRTDDVPQATKEFVGREGIAWISPVFVAVGSGLEMVVPNEIIVSFVSANDADSFFAEHDGRLQKTDALFTNQWVLSLGRAQQ